MTTAFADQPAHDAIAQTLQLYLDGARSGKGDDMKPAFHGDATIFGYIGADLEARIASVDVADTIATVRVELDNWTGNRFTDLFTLLKVDGDWKITNKVFHLHV